MPLTKRIGVSTRFLPAAHGEDIWIATQQVLEAGIRGLELVPADYQGEVGAPYTTRSVGLWPRGFSRDDRERLRGVLAQFDTVTIHAPHLGLNISSANPGVREETARQYIECIQLAAATGVRIVTFESGSQTPGFIADPEDIIRPMIRFGKLACEFADDHDLTLAYSAGDFAQLRQIIGAINHPRFGVSLDLGRAALGGHPVSEWVEHFGERIVKVQVGGVLNDRMGYAEHQPLERNNVVEYHEALSALKAAGYAGPLQCEIQGLDIADAVGHCLAARSRLNAIWQSLEPAPLADTDEIADSAASEPVTPASEETRDTP